VTSVAARKSGMLRMPSPDELAELAGVWRWDPSAFAEDVLGITLWDDDGDSQRKIAQAMPHHTRISVRSGHKTGKSTVAAVLALWAWAMLPKARVVLTAPTEQQITEVVWREIRRLYLGAIIPLGPPEWLALSPRTGLRHPDGRQIFARAASKPEAFSGISSPNVVYIADEASGIGEDIFEAMEGNAAGGAWIILLSNPTQVTGTFYTSHTTQAHLWRRFHLDSERVAHRINPHGEVPGLATPGWAETANLKWGKGSPQHDVRVRGNFPQASDYQVIGLSLVEDAQRRWSERVFRPSPKHPRLVVGVDVARFGNDKSVAYGRRGRYVMPPLEKRNVDGPLLAIHVLRYVESLMFEGEGRMRGTDWPTIRVDNVGVGASCYDALRQLREDRSRRPSMKLRTFDLEAVNTGVEADDPEQFFNARTQLAFGLRDAMKEGLAIPPSGEMQSELVAPRYSFDPRGRFKLERKDETKQRIARSPDHFDALCMAVYEGTRFSAATVTLPGLLG